MASDNNLIVVDGVVLPQPYQYTWSLSDVSAGESGRTDDALMHKNRVAQKRQLQIAWRAKDTAVTAKILTALNPEYVSIRYFDMLDNQYETRKFYIGDRSVGVKKWWVGSHLIDTITLDAIER